MAQGTYIRFDSEVYDTELIFYQYIDNPIILFVDGELDYLKRCDLVFVYDGTYTTTVSLADFGFDDYHSGFGYRLIIDGVFDNVIWVGINRTLNVELYMDGFSQAVYGSTTVIERKSTLTQSKDYIRKKFKNILTDKGVSFNGANGWTSLVDKITDLDELTRSKNDYLTDISSYTQQSSQRYDNGFSPNNPTIATGTVNDTTYISIPRFSQLCHNDEFTVSNKYTLTFKFRMTSYGYDGGFAIGEPSSCIISTLQGAFVSFDGNENGTKTGNPIATSKRYTDFVNVKIIRDGTSWHIDWNDGDVTQTVTGEAKNKIGFLNWKANSNLEVYDMELKIGTSLGI